MTAVQDLLAVLDGEEISYWLDGGWGVDCLLEEQTRPHGDLDLVVSRGQLADVARILTARGHVGIRDWLPTTVAWRDGSGAAADLHPVDPTADGGGDQVLQDGSVWHDGAPVVGRIQDREVRCAPADEQIAVHQGYESRPVDVDDVRRLAARFGLPLPDAFVCD